MNWQPLNTSTVISGEMVLPVRCTVFPLSPCLCIRKTGNPDSADCDPVWYVVNRTGGHDLIAKFCCTDLFWEVLVQY